MAVSFKKHLLYAGLFLVAALVFIGVRNWDTIEVMIENASTLNEGGSAAAEITSPDDLLAYMQAHPEQVSLAAFDVGAEEDGIYVRADSLRAVTALPKLQVTAEYHRRVLAGRLDPDRRVSLAAVEAFALPGVTAENHRRAVDTLRARGLVEAGSSDADADSTVALRHWARVALQMGDDAATDWLLHAWGAEAVQAVPRRLGMPRSHAPQPATGTYLTWTNTEVDRAPDEQLRHVQRAGHDSTYAQAFAYARRLVSDNRFRNAERSRLSEGGSGLTLRQQRDFALATYPGATARDYASLLGRIAAGSLSPDAAGESAGPDGSAAREAVSDTAWARRMQDALEQPVQTDTTQMVFTHVASKSGAYPGLLVFAGYARRTGDHPPRVVVLLMEDVPTAVLYHLVQTGIDKGLQLQLLGDDAYFERVRKTLS